MPIIVAVSAFQAYVAAATTAGCGDRACGFHPPGGGGTPQLVDQGGVAQDKGRL
jgi:hypothetical protein